MKRLALAVTLLLALSACGGSREEAEEAEPTATTVPTTATTELQPTFHERVMRLRTATTTTTVVRTSISDGIYRVGIDIPPGLYQTAGFISGPCYFARRGRDGTIIESKYNEYGAPLMWVRETDAAFETSGCGEWEWKLASVGREE